RPHRDARISGCECVGSLLDLLVYWGKSRTRGQIRRHYATRQMSGADRKTESGLRPGGFAKRSGGTGKVALDPAPHEIRRKWGGWKTNCRVLGRQRPDRQW